MKTSLRSLYVSGGAPRDYYIISAYIHYFCRIRATMGVTCSLIVGADSRPWNGSRARIASGAIAKDHAARNGASGPGRADLSRVYCAVRAPVPALAVRVALPVWAAFAAWTGRAACGGG